MTRTTPRAQPSTASTFAKPARRIVLLFALIAAGGLAASQAHRALAAAPAPGDTFVYQVTDGYNREPRGQVSYQVNNTDAGRVVMSVITERLGTKFATTEVYNADGNWLRHSIINRDHPIDYEFTQAYPAYEMPLETGKQWSGRVNAVNPATGKTRSVRVDATVVGTERIRVPAGEFDTVKIKRSVYAGDAEYNLRETTISEMDWFAPALGRSVRVTRNSGYLDLSAGRFSRVVRGDWNIYELVSASAPR